MRNRLRALITGVLLVSSAAAIAQQRSSELKTIPDSINFIWKNIEQDFAVLAEAMPEDKWSFKPTHGEFKDAQKPSRRPGLRAVMSTLRGDTVREGVVVERGVVTQFEPTPSGFERVWHTVFFTRGKVLP